MNQSDGFMHKGVPYNNPMPPQSGVPNGNGQNQAPPVDYDDGYGKPPPMPASSNANGHAANGNGNGHLLPAMMPGGSPTHPMPGNGHQQLQPMPGYGHQQPQPMPGNGYQQPMPATPAQGQPMPQNGVPPGGQQAAQQNLATPLDLVLPVFDSYNPLDVLGKLQEMWNRYESFSSGVADTRQFPFSAIVGINAFFKSKADPGQVADGAGTGFYIGPNLILTVAHNFAEDSSFAAAHTATLYTGLNSTQGVGVAPLASDAIHSETIDPATAVKIHPLYSSSDPSISQAHDIAVVRVSTPAPNGQFFRIANFSPAGDQPIAVCGYGASSRGQRGSDPDWRKLLTPAQCDWKQHMDVDRIRELANNGEGILYNAQTLSGNSGSPVFLKPANTAGDDPMELMQVVAVHSRGAENFYNHGVLMTPDKRNWALSGGTIAVQQSYYPPNGHRGQYYGQQMGAPAWVSIAGALIGAATTAGIAGLQSSSGDLTWSLQKMDGWLPAGAHPTPTIGVDRSRIQTRRNVEINSPVYQGTLQGDMYAHFFLDYQYDGSGVGGISIEPAPHDSHDNLTGGMRIDMQINPLLETFPSQTQTEVRVACVEVKMMYTYEWTVDDNDQVTVVYRFYGDGTYESNVRGGSARLDATDTTYSQHRR